MWTLHLRILSAKKRKGVLASRKYRCKIGGMLLSGGGERERERDIKDGRPFNIYILRLVLLRLVD